MDNTIIPDDKSSWYEGFSGTREDIATRGRILLEAESNDKEDFDSYKMARAHYKSCINEDKLEELGVEPILNYLGKVKKTALKYKITHYHFTVFV